MDLQYVADLSGKPTAVIIPINEWEKIKRVYFKQLSEFDEFNEYAVLKDIEHAVNEMNSVKNGKLKSRPLEELINEL